MRYREIAEAVRELIATGQYGTGGELPSEAELARRYPASRVTIRKALDELRSEGIVRSRRGSGWYVAVDPVRQALGRFSTVEDALEAAGVGVRREVIEYSFEPASPAVADALDLRGDAEVLRVMRVNFADEEPFGVVTVWIPKVLGERMSRFDAEESTFYALLSRDGVELGAATQTITAGLATGADAARMHVRPGQPVLVCRRVTRDASGRPVLYSEHRYPAHRTSFEVELPRVAPAGDGPVGLRLIDAAGAGTTASEHDAAAS